MTTLAASSPRLKARLAGVFYAITVVTGAYALFAGAGQPLGHVSNLVAGAAYVVVTVLLYKLLRPVDKDLSLLAAFFSLIGVANTQDGFFFFGCYCLLVGYLVFRSGFMPRAVGVLMALAGVGLLANTVAKQLSPAFAHSLGPFPTVLDGLGELSLTLWLIVFGVDAARWEERARQAQ